VTASEAQDAVHTPNPPGQSELRRQVAPHALALARMRDRLGAPGTDITLRSLARGSPGEVAIALLDAWAVVADTVSFYSERIAVEGFLRTAVQRRSVRELSRTLGYELRPGVAAQLDLSFTAETAPGAPEVITVPAGTPVQSIPGPGELPQTFQTGADLEVRPGWNSLAAIDSRPQTIPVDQSHVWVRGPTTVRAGDTVLVISTQLVLGIPPTLVQRRNPCTVIAVVADPAGYPGWTRLDLGRPVTASLGLPLTSVRVHAFRERLRLFGWNAPDPNLLVVDDKNPPGSEDEDPDGTTENYVWTGYSVVNPIEIDSDHPALLPGGWVVLDQPGQTEPFVVTAVESDGGSKFALTGPLTRVTVEPSFGEGRFSRNQVLVHGVSTELPGSEQPDETPVAPTSLVVAASDPPLPPGRRILLRGTDTTTDEVTVVATDVEACSVAADGTTMTLTVTGPLPPFARQGLVVLGNVATATHGESVAQVLGSGSGRASFTAFRPRRAPLTYVRATTPGGARAELTVRVDGVQWQEIESLADAGPGDRVYAVRHDEDGSVRVVLGDGIHGARPAGGTENISAEYRVGIGEAGAVQAGAVSMLVRRPLGIREVGNPLPAQDWAPAETLEEARTNAPLRIRTLDRAVSVADHEDFARGYAGVGPARADLLWDGRTQRVLVTVLGAAASSPSGNLVHDLHRALEEARDPAAPLDVSAGEVVWCGLRVEVGHDPAYERQPVLDAVLAALTTSFGAAARTFASPVTAAGVLVVVRSVPGVAACTMPRLFGLASLPPPPTPPTLLPDDEGRDIIPALPGRCDGQVLPAQLVALADGAAEIGEMTL
jgi:predicted phage baseplate assembly protein